MTRIDFYILQDVEVDAMHRFACTLASKAMDAGSQVVIHTADEATAQAIDELLWGYPDSRFIPHGLHKSPAAKRAPVQVCWEEPETYDGVLVNLTTEVPDFFGRFDRVAEIVVGQTRVPGRLRYKFYRDRGFPLYSHDLDDWEAA